MNPCCCWPGIGPYCTQQQRGPSTCSPTISSTHIAAVKTMYLYFTRLSSPVLEVQINRWNLFKYHWQFSKNNQGEQMHNFLKEWHFGDFFISRFTLADTSYLINTFQPSPVQDDKLYIHSVLLLIMALWSFVEVITRDFCQSKDASKIIKMCLIPACILQKLCE